MWVFSVGVCGCMLDLACMCGYVFVCVVVHVVGEYLCMCVCFPGVLCVCDCFVLCLFT